MTNRIKFAAADGSKTNFGMAIMELDLDTLEISVLDLILTKTEKSKNKQVRASSDNLERAQAVASPIPAALKDCVCCFVEVPSGGQSYDAVLGFGIVIGIYACIEGMLGVQTLEVSPSETKLAAVGTKSASKQEMIEWATGKFPDACWRTHRGKPTLDNEHLADAVAIGFAGIKTTAFKSMLAMLRASSRKAA